MELELFPLFDMEAIKSGAKKNKLSTSVKLQTLQGENINSEEELQANSLHVRMTYKNLDFAEKNIKEHEFENCTFESCHFVKANLTAVAFMDCKFQNCDFVVKIEFNTPCDEKAQRKYEEWKNLIIDDSNKVTGELTYSNVKIELPWEQKGENK